MLIFFFLISTHSFADSGVVGGGQSTTSKSALTLEVTRSTHPVEEFHGSHWYFADLRNSGSKAVTVVAIKRPEGYQGGGLVFSCYLEVWKKGRKQWRPLWSPSLANYGYGPSAELKDVEVKPGASERVCGLLLPRDAGAGANGKCVRFGMRTRWTASPDRIVLVSKPFIIGDSSASRRTPCSTK